MKNKWKKGRFLSILGNEGGVKAESARKSNNADFFKEKYGEKGNFCGSENRNVLKH